jgi:DNA-binding protein Fis
VVNNITGENKTFVSLRKAAEYLGINQSYLAKSIKEQKFYFGRDFLVYKSLTNLEEIIESEAYKERVTKGNTSKTKLRHSEASKELIRQANLGKKLSLELKQKLSLNSKNAKSVLVTNNETMEILEFPSIVAAAKHIGVDESTVRKCIKAKKACKNYTVLIKSEENQ